MTVKDSDVQTSIYRISFIGKDGKWEHKHIDANSKNEFQAQLESFKSTIDHKRIMSVDVFTLDSKLSEW